MIYYLLAYWVGGMACVYSVCSNLQNFSYVCFEAKCKAFFILSESIRHVLNALWLAVQYVVKTVCVFPCIISVSVCYHFTTPYELSVKSCDSSVRIATRLRAGRSWLYGSIPGGAGNEFFSSPLCPERLRGPPNLLSNAYLRLFPWG
jgi:hypothetical protein